MERKINTKQLIKCLKSAEFFGVVRYGETALLYTNCLILSGKDMNVDELIVELIKDGYIKVGDTYRWLNFGIVKDYRHVQNVADVYRRIIDAPRDKALFSYHARVSWSGNIIGYEFSVNMKNETLNAEFFKMFDGSEFEFANENKSFIVNGKHVVTPLICKNDLLGDD